MKIEVVKNNEVVIIENTLYPSTVVHRGSNRFPEIGADYLYLVCSDSPWVESYYVDLNNHVQAFNEVQKEHLLNVCNGWVQELGQEGNPTLEQAKSYKKLQFKEEFVLTIESMTDHADPSEMASWAKQEAEARAYAEDNNAITPIIDNLLIGRNMGESKADLVGKIIAKADGYAVAYAQVLGMYHAKQKALEACTTVEEVLAL